MIGPQITFEEHQKRTNTKFKNIKLIWLEEHVVGSRGLSRKGIYVCEKHGEFESKIPWFYHTKFGCEKCAYEQRALNNIGINKIPKEKLEKLNNLSDNWIFTISPKPNKIIVKCSVHNTEEERWLVAAEKCPCVQCKKDLKNKQTEENKLKRNQEKEIQRQNKLKELNEIKQKKLLDKEQQKLKNKLKRMPYNYVSFEEYLSRLPKEFLEKYTYIESSYTGSKGNITFICPKHKEVTQLCYEHVKSTTGCRFCSVNNKSKQEADWLLSLNFNLKYQQKIVYSGKKYFLVDALDTENKIIYEYLGDYWHGNLAVYAPDKINKNNKQSFQELYNKTLLKFQTLSSLGYKIIYTWENDWLNSKINRVFNNKLEY